jgi:hypothetical protein
VTAVHHREEGASAPSDPESVVSLAADYRAAFDHLGRQLARFSELEEKLFAIRGRGNVVFLRERTSLRQVQRDTDRAKAIADDAGEVCDAIERRAARVVPETMAELRASAALFAFIDEVCAGMFADKATVEAWCRSLALGILRLTA